MSDEGKLPPGQGLRSIVAELEKTMRCVCDLDNWEPEGNTGHTCVCPIRNKALAMLHAEEAKP